MNSYERYGSKITNDSMRLIVMRLPSGAVASCSENISGFRSKRNAAFVMFAVASLHARLHSLIRFERRRQRRRSALLRRSEAGAKQDPRAGDGLRVEIASGSVRRATEIAWLRQVRAARRDELVRQDRLQPRAFLRVGRVAFLRVVRAEQLPQMGRADRHGASVVAEDSDVDPAATRTTNRIRMTNQKRAASPGEMRSARRRPMAIKSHVVEDVGVGVGARKRKIGRSRLEMRRLRLLRAVVVVAAAADGVVGRVPRIQNSL